MKRLLAVCLAAALLLAPLSVLADMAMKPTNLDGVTITTERQVGNEWFTTDKTLLFVNGSLASSDVAIVNGRAVVSAAWLAEALGADVSGLKETTVPLRATAEALGWTVGYYDGAAKAQSDEEWLAETAARYVPRVKQIMVSRYPEELTPLTAGEALAVARAAVARANEKAREDFRVDTAKMRVFGENDRYYMVRVGFDFWVDKYTGDIYVFYNGQNMQFWKFDPEAAGALVFAG